MAALILLFLAWIVSWAGMLVVPLLATWRAPTARKKWFRATVALILWVGFFYGDAIVGRAYLYGLCVRHGGVEIYTTVPLEDKFWGKDGLPIVSRYSIGDGRRIGEKYQIVHTNRQFSLLGATFNERVLHLRSIDPQHDIATHTDFDYWGG